MCSFPTMFPGSGVKGFNSSQDQEASSCASPPHIIRRQRPRIATDRRAEKYLSTFPNFVGGWNCALEAAVARHNRSHTTALECSPNFVAFGQASYLSADIELGIKDDLVLMKEKKPR